MSRFRSGRWRATLGSMIALAALAVAGANVTGIDLTRPERVSPDLCTVSPLTSSDLVDIVAIQVTAPAGQPTIEPSGHEADQETREAVTETIRESVACANANDQLRALALFTDRYLRERFGGENQDDLGHLLAAVTRDYEEAEEEDRLILVSIDDVQVLEDGRVAARVVTENAKMVFTDTLVLERIAGRWLIDEVIALEPPLSPTPNG